MGKTYTAKTSPGDFNVTTPENSLLSQQMDTSKRILVPYEGKSGFVSHTKLTAEATFMDLFHS